jgi:hypothetical protein
MLYSTRVSIFSSLVYLDSHTCIVETAWDIERYADSIKQVKLMAKHNAAIPLEMARLCKYYQPPGEPREEVEPATILDCHSRIVAWSLPDILCDYTVVRKQYSMHCACTN